MLDEGAVRLAPATLGLEAAQEWLSWISKVWTARDMDTMLAMFAPDVVVDYADQPRMHGVGVLRPFLEARFARYAEYSLRKTALAAHGDHVVAELDIRWRGTDPGSVPVRLRAMEFLVVRDGRISRWSMASNAHPDLA